MAEFSNKQEEFSNENPAPKLSKYVCEICQFTSCNKNNYKKHLLTNKHKLQEMQCSSNNNLQKMHNCLCGKTYCDYSGLWKHKKVCKLIQSNTDDKEDYKELIKLIIKENGEMIKNVMIDVMKAGIANNSSNKYTFFKIVRNIHKIQ